MSRRNMIPYAVSVASLVLIPVTSAASYLEAPAVASYNASSSGFTVECWIKVRFQPGYDPRIIRCVGPTEGPCGDGSTELWELFICKASACTPGRVFFAIQDAGVCHELQSSAGVTDGNYHHVAGTYDGAVMRVFVDGALSDSLLVTGANVQVAGGKVVVGNATNYNNPFDGQIDEVRIWSVARTGSQIFSDMTTEIATGPGLAGYWRLNGDGTDLVGGNTVIPTGNVSFVTGRLNEAAFIVNFGGGGGLPACSDGIDNDGDGCTDYPNDPGCASAQDDSEAEASCAPPPPPPPSGMPIGALTLWILAVLVSVLGAWQIRRRHSALAGSRPTS